MQIKYWAATDVGRKRSDNEDNYLIDQALNLFVLADGMGGHAAGEVASALAVHTVREIVASQSEVLLGYDGEDPRAHIEICTLLEHAIHVACERIHRKAQREPEKRGMGTTVIVLLLLRSRGFIAYVGDSRIYLSRAGAVYQLTEDHSLMNELVRRGKIRADEFDESPYARLKNAMTRAVGVNETVEVDTLDFDVVPGDAFLLCSDGLYDYLEDPEIIAHLGFPNVEEIPARFIEIANTRGGKDNITAVVVQIPDDGSTDRAAQLNHTLDTLRRLPLFRQLTHQQLVRILNATRQQTVPAGHDLCREGDVGGELFVLLSGEIELSKGGTAITRLDPGAYLGEMSLLDAQPRSATATAVVESRVVSLTREDFHEILRKEAPLAVKLLWSFLTVVADRLRQTTSELSDARRQQIEDFTEDLAAEELAAEELADA